MLSPDRDSPFPSDRLIALVDEARALTGAAAVALSLTASPVMPEQQVFIARSPRDADLPARAQPFAQACRDRRAMTTRGAEVGHTEGHWTGLPLTGEHEGICGLLHLYTDQPLSTQAMATAGLLARLAAATVAAVHAGKRIADLEAEVAQRDAMLRESHHRITNNIASVASLLQMQARAQTAPEVRQQLLEAAGRVHTFGRIHESLYRSGEVQTIAIGEHLTGLLREIAATGWTKSSTPPAVEVACPSEACMPTQAATTLSLIAVELVMNALKHAGTPDSRLRIAVTIEMGTEIRLRVVDNGPGFPGIVRRDRPSFGLTLVEALAKQLEGRLDLGSGEQRSGAAVTVTFPAVTPA